MSFSFFGSGTTQTASGSTTRTLTVPSTIVARQALFLWAGGRSTLNTIDFSPPSGWTEVGSILRTDATGIPGSGTRPHGALRMWWKVATPTDASSTVTVTAVNHYEYRIGLFVYESDSGEWPAIVDGPQDDTTGSVVPTGGYTPPAFASTVESVCVTIATAFPDLSGGIGSGALAGFTVEEQFNAGSSNEPPLVVADLVVTAGSITLPTWVDYTRPYVSKTFALSHTVRRGGPHVGFLVG